MVLLKAKNRQTSRSIRTEHLGRAYARQTVVLVINGNTPRASVQNAPIEAPGARQWAATKNLYNYTIPTKKIAMNLKKLDKYKSYEQGWNGYNGLKFDSNMIEDIKMSLYKVSHQPHISPTGRGSIQFDYVKGEDSLEIEIFSDKVEILQIKEGDEQEYETTIDQLGQYVTQFYAD